ncbi:hypothetical protein D5086_016607 [Populus alba]|uniref:Uncharacterized protein n=1 Tax=Populus alba TaxID=43335 RepID=A0ACC4BUJ9_POPAL
MHQEAIDDVTIQGMPQCIFAHYPGNSNIIIFRSLILSRYQTLSDHSLVTLGAWSPKRVEMATRVIVEAQKKNSGGFQDKMLGVLLVSISMTQNIDREEAGKMTLYCTVVLRNKQETTEVMNKAMPSFECITLKNKAAFN